MQLFICEKPSQAADYAKALDIKGGKKNGYIEGNNVIITWCFGHLLAPLNPSEYDEKYKKWDMKELPMFVTDKWEYKQNPKTKPQLKIIRELLKKAKEVVIASDADREGELIVVSLLEKYAFKGKRTRTWTSALDKATLKKAIDNRKDAKDTYNEYLAAMTRQKADWTLGMNLTRAMTKINQGYVEGVLSVGRVQTPVLNLIVLRDLEIDNFKSKNYYDMKAIFSFEGGELKADWNMPKEFLDPEEKKCLDKTHIEKTVAKIKGHDGLVTKSEKTRKKESAPLLYSLSELQKDCDTKFGLNLEETLNIAQSLYETHKATTYPRSDCQYINTAQFSDVPIIMEAIKKSDPNTKEIIDFVNGVDLKIKTKVWNTKKVEDSAHHAIIPTVSPFNINALNDIEAKVYDLIRRRYIAQFYPEAEVDASKIEIECQGETFKVTGTMPVSSGWKDILGKKSESKEIPSLNKGDILTNAKPKIESKNTTPPARYTNTTLLDAMLNPSKFVESKSAKSILKGTEGIGTEATRATIMKVLFERDYIKQDKRNLISTSKGKGLIHYVPEKSKSIEMTAFWESQLELISKGKLEPEVFIKEQQVVITEMIDQIKKGECTFKNAVGALYTCPTCNSGLKKLKAKTTGNLFWVCLSDNNCGTYPDNRGKPFFPKPVDQGTVEHTCEVCNKGKLTRKVSKNKVFYWQCAESDCKQFYSDNEMTPKLYIKEVIEQGAKEHTCFECGKAKLERKKGQYGFYWKCLDSKCSKNFKEDEKMNPIKPVAKATSEHQCPNCKSGRLLMKQGKNGAFWGCNAFPKCRTILSDKDGKPDFKK